MEENLISYIKENNAITAEKGRINAELDHVHYVYKDGHNTLTITKKLES